MENKIKRSLVGVAFGLLACNGIMGCREISRSGDFNEKVCARQERILAASTEQQAIYLQYILRTFGDGLKNGDPKTAENFKKYMKIGKSGYDVYRPEEDAIRYFGNSTENARAIIEFRKCRLY